MQNPPADSNRESGADICEEAAWGFRGLRVHPVIS